MPGPAIEDYRWLTSDDADPWLARANLHGGELASLVRLLRRDLSPERAHLIVEQLDLRRRAKGKFSRPEQMLFTRRALEQASGEAPAAYKASRFATGAAVLDLCCGIGGDLVALAARGPAAGVDRDPVITLLAEHNCRRLGLAETRVEAIDAAEAAVGACEAWHIDPDRRAMGRRATRVEQYEPGVGTIEGLLTVCNAAAIKLAPAAVAPERWADKAEIEWIGDLGECKQQVAWFGHLACHAGQRRATVLFAEGAPRTIVGHSHGELPFAAEIGQYVFEPHAAVLAARLANVLCAEHGLASIADHGGYLTGDTLVNDSALARFEVCDVLPFDVKRLKGWLREHSIGRLEIKVRGMKEDVPDLRRRLQVPGDNAATVMLTRFRGLVMGIVAERQSK